MKIGIAYDLREDYLAEGFGEEETAEFDRLDTIEAIEGTLERLGFETDPIGNIRKLAARLVAGDRWDMVFNIAEGLRGFGTRGPGPGSAGCFRNSLHLFRSSRSFADASQGDDQARDSRLGHPHP